MHGVGLRNRRRLLVASGVAALLLVTSASPLFALPMPWKCPTFCTHLENEFVRTDIGPAGTWVLGTTGGDPDTSRDDNRALLYGYERGGESVVGSGYTTIRVIGPAGTYDRVPSDRLGLVSGPDKVSTSWSGPAPYQVTVTETIRLKKNRFSGRVDAAELCYEALNVDRVPLSVGLRALLDVKIGENDGAPYFVPGVGAITHETEFVGDRVPAFWLAFESETYDPMQLRTVGIMRGSDVREPDRFMIAYWVRIQSQDWHYQVRPTDPVTRDSAVALYWDPEPLAPGTSKAMCTQYGVASNKGGSAFLTAPVEATCGTEIPAAVFVNNFDPATLTGGQATIALPPGIRLAAGETASKTMPDVEPGATGSSQWKLVIDPTTSGKRDLSAVVTFASGPRFEAEAKIDVDCPLATPSVTPTATIGPTPTATSEPTATPTLGPVPPKVCSFIVGRVPAAVINWALANPHEVYGWGMLTFEGQPEGPFNPPRSWLSVRNIGAQYHRMHNPVVFKGGCP